MATADKPAPVSLPAAPAMPPDEGRRLPTLVLLTASAAAVLTALYLAAKWSVPRLARSPQGSAPRIDLTPPPPAGNGRHGHGPPRWARRSPP